MRRYGFLFCLLCFSVLSFAQVNDAFDDGDFTAGTVWSGFHSDGNADHFEIAESDNQLKSQSLSGGSGTRVSYLSTTDGQDLSSSTAEWNFRFRLGFSRPSSSSSSTNGRNTSRVFLMSNTADLSGDLNGYYVELRYPGTSDFNEVRLYRQDAGTTTELALSGTIQTVTSQDFATVKVTRSSAGEWEVLVNATSQGTVTDNTYDATTHFGVQIRYSATSRSDLFYFDDFSTTYSTVVDTDPPALTSITANSSTEVVIDFNENVDETTAQTSTNYVFDNSVDVTNAVRNASNNSQVTLSVSGLTSGTNYTVTINNVEDESGNVIDTDSDISFEYIEFATAGVRDVVINELMIDENPSQGLPTAEFIELYNPTDNFFDLENWGISDDENPSSSEQFGTFTLRPDSYVIICDDANESLFTSFGDVVTVSNLGALTNSGDVVVLTDDGGNIIDELSYSSAPADGITYEQINPELPCNGEFNYAESTDTNGGTPGAQNTVFDDSPDASAPEVTSLVVVESDSIQITFSEPLDQTTVTTGSFSLTGFTISEVSFSADQVVDLLLTSDLLSENTYTLGYSGITDCSGNDLSDTSTEFYYDQSAPVLDRLVIVTDNSFFLVFNEPLKESEAETEANFSLDQSFGAPSRATLQDTASNRILLEFDEGFAEGTTYTITYDMLEDTTGNALTSADRAFTFRDQIDSVYALTGNILEVTFSEAPAGESATKLSNYFLEDVGNPTSVLAGGDDLTYRLVFDATMDDNSDLLLYIENVLNGDETDTLGTPAFSFRYDTDSPSLSSLTVTSSTKLQLLFDEALNSDAATNLNNYELENDETPIEATLDEATVSLTFANDFETEQEKTLTYTEIEDLFGNRFTSNRTIDFVYDPLAPAIDSLYQTSDTTIAIWASEAISLASIDANNFSADSQQAISFEIQGPDSLMLTMTYGSDLNSEEELSFSVAEWEDQNGNSLSEPIDSSLNTLDPRVASTQFVTDSTVQITFSQSMGSSAYEADNYNIVGLTINSLTDAGDNTAEIEISGKFTETNYELSISDVTNGSGNSLQFETLDLTFETFLSSVTILDELTIELKFETEFESFPGANIQVVDNNPDLVSIDPDDPTEIQLLLTESLTENSEISIYWQDIEDRFGRSLPDHTTIINYDVQPPSIDRVESALENIIQVIFDEPFDEQTAGSLMQYTITSVGNPQSLDFLNDSTIQLTFSALNTGTDYELVVQDIADQNGNFTDTDNLDFTYNPPEIIAENLVVISEIMADPSPSVGLPEAEYLELLNVTERTLDLASLRISNDTDTLRLTSYELVGGASVILVDAGDATTFSEYNTLAVQNLFSLDNSGELLVLSNINDELVDSLTFSSDWYGDATRSDGGYSLELIEPLSDCSNESNWSVTESSNGGTPGTSNSLSPETEAPVVEASSLSGNTISITFNEEMNESTLVSASFSVSGGLSLSTLNPSLESVELTYTGELTEGQTFDLTLSGLADCKGNAMADTTLTFIISAIPTAGDLLISEIMADPSPVVGLPESEYLEIYNASDSIINLEGLVLTKEGSNTTLPAYFLDPGAYVAIIDENASSLFDGYETLAVSDLISLANSSDSIVLQTSTAEVLDQVEYESAWYGDADKDDGGYSLELIDLSRGCSDAVNWGASVATAGGTPGAANSQTVETEAPLVSASSIAGNTLTVTFNEEMNESTLVSASFSISGGLSLSTITPSLSSVELIYTGELTEGQTFDLTLSSLADCKGNTMADTTLTFIISAVPTAGDLLISEIMADPSPVVGLPESEYLEIYNASDSIINLEGLVLAKEGSNTTLPAYFLDPGAYVAIIDENASSLFDGYETLSVSDLISLANSSDSIVLQTSTAGVLDRVEYVSAWYGDADKDDGGYSLELIDLSRGCSDEVNWGASAATAGGTPGAANSQTVETEAPLVEASSLSGNTLTINFNEEMNASTLVAASFSISGGLSLSTISPSSESVELTYTGELTEGQTFDLTLSGLADCKGNAMADTIITFVISAVPTAGDLLISEIMADPSPVVGLPESEYLEIYNASDSIINLEGLVLAKEGSNTTLPAYFLDPGAYVAIIDENVSSPFDGYETLAVSDLISFANSSDSIVLQTSTAEVLDRVEYESAWYGDADKDDGGYSLELIDLSRGCSDAVNWGASVATAGGTPGAANSQTAETEAPEVSSTAINESTLTITFNEEMNASTLVLASFSISGGLSLSTVNPLSESVELNYTGELTEGQTFDLTLSGLADCKGNAMADTTITFVISAIPTAGDLLISEIMADPSPVVGLPESEYLEIYNASDSIINLEGLVLSKEGSSTALTSYFLDPGAYVAIIDNSASSLYDGYATLAVSDLISLANSSDSIVLQTSTAEVLDRVEYESAWYGDADKDDGGYSLELTDLSRGCSDEVNWGASIATAGGTPGAANSQTVETEAPEVSSTTINENTLTINFNEEMNESTLVSASFSVSGGLSLSTVNPSSESVELTYTGELTEGQTFDLTLSGLADCKGNAMADTTLTFIISAIAQASDLYINELMVDPSPSVGLPEVEYIEIFNASDSIINLGGLVLAKSNGATILSDYALAAKAYVAIVDQNDLALMEGYHVLGVRDLISFSNDRDSIVLRDSDQVVLDWVQYDDSWYGDPTKDDGGYSLELINPVSECSPANRWGASLAIAGGTPGAANAISSETESPMIVESILSGNQLSLGFSEEMLASSINIDAINSTFLISDFKYDQMEQMLRLTFEESIVSEQRIELPITGFADCSGNIINDTTLVFLQAVNPTFNDVIITEVMSDPDPEVGLPNREYLEIFNRSQRILDLNEMVIQDASGNSSPIGGVILPGEYQVLVATSGISDFDGLNVNGVGSFPGLSNGGEQLTLFHGEELIFSLRYTIDWHDSDKREGGYALEMRDTNNPCGTTNNWGSTVSLAGGTPGAENSIKQEIPDNFGPDLFRAIAVNDDSVHLEFSELLIPTFRPVISLSGGIEVTETVIPQDALDKVYLSLNQALQRGVIYTITVELLQDCLGNSVGINTAELVLPFEAETSQILLSEVLFNPLDDGVDFVEVHNTTDQFVSLKGWSFGNESVDRVITEDDLIIEPEGYLAFTEDVARLQLDFPNAPSHNLIEVDDLPTYSNEFGSVYLMDANRNDQDSLFYDEDFHSDLLRSVDGVSLERISFDAPNDGNNWNSAASTIGFGTPGAPNSQSLDLSAFNDPVQAEPRVFVPGSGSNSFTTINYEFETAGNFANITLYDQNGRFVKELARGVSLGADGFIRWDGTGAGGGVVRVGYYVVVFEVFNSSGQSEVIKETVVVGRDF